MNPPHTWWIDQPSLLASRNPTHEELAQLRLQGFLVLVSLLEEHRQPPRYGKKSAAAAGWRISSMPIAEGGVPTLDQLGALMARLKGYARGTRVVVHCETGQGRAALLGAAWWIAKGLTVSEALARIAQAGVPPAWATEPRRQLLRQWREVNGMLGQSRAKVRFPRPGAARG